MSPKSTRHQVDAQKHGQHVRIGEVGRTHGQWYAFLVTHCAAKRALLLSVSAPFHSSLMKPAAEALKLRLASTGFSAMQFPVINNIDVASVADAAGLRQALYAQAFGAVRWVEVVQALKGLGLTHIIECGPGKVLAGMIKRIDADIVTATVLDSATLAQARELLG